MARTKRNAMNIAEARKKIQTAMLINQLQKHVQNQVDMKPTQVTAALGLLKKSIPDLASHQHTGEGGGPIKYQAVNTGITRG